MLAAQDTSSVAGCSRSIAGRSTAFEPGTSMLPIEPHSKTAVASHSQVDNRDRMENDAFLDQTHSGTDATAVSSTLDSFDGTSTTRSRLRQQGSPLPGLTPRLEQQHHKSKPLHEPSSPRSLTNSEYSAATLHDHYSHRFLRKKASDDSIRSNMSTSSVISVASKLSRFPQAVIKSSIGSVKGFVAKSRAGKARNGRLTVAQGSCATVLDQQHPQTIHYSTPASAPFGDRGSIASRLRRKTPSSLGLYTMFSSPSQKDRCLHVADVADDAKSGYSVPDDSDIGTTNTSSPRLYDITASPRNNTESAAAVRLVSPAHPLLNENTFTSPSPTAPAEPIGRLEFDNSIAAVGDPKAVGELLFGVDIGSMDFFDQELGKSATSSTLSGLDDCDLDPIETSPDAKGNYAISEIGNEGVWGRQRAKSCQETKVTCLRQLARGQYASTATLNSHIPSSALVSIPASEPSKKSNDASYDGLRDVLLPEVANVPLTLQDQQQNRKLADAKIGTLYNNILVTATLTTLHSKLINDCDQLLATTIFPPPPSPAGNNEPRKFPEDALRRTVSDLQKMTDMVEWETGDGPLSKRAVVAFFRVIEGQIDLGSSMTTAAYTTSQPPSKKDKNIRPFDPSQMMATSVKDIIALLKHMINQSICQYYKVYERSMILPCKNYRIEGTNRLGSCDDDYTSVSQDYSQCEVEHMDTGAYWFREYFVNKDYMTFLCHSADDNGPVLMTAVCEKRDLGDGGFEQQYRLIIRGKRGPDVRTIIPDSFLLRAPPSSTEYQEESDQVQQQHIRGGCIPDLTWKAVAETSLNIPFDKFKKIDIEDMISSGLQNDTLMLDEQAVHDRYKFGILYVKGGQTREEEWLSNDCDSEGFGHFLGVIGRKIKLTGYTGWTGGLDTKSGYSGEYTYVDEWNNHSIAYHVSTLIPAHPGDNQQVQKKRHIGNDIACVVYVEGKQPFNPAAIKSQFLHVFIVVHPEEWQGRKGWRVEVVVADNVPFFCPTLQENAIFFDEKELRSFMLAKLINAEYAAYRSPKFAQPMARAREGILAHIAERGLKVSKDLELAGPAPPFIKHSKSLSSSSDRSSKSGYSTGSDFVPTPPRSSMIKEYSDGMVPVIGRRRSGQDQDARVALSSKPVRTPKQRKGKTGTMVTPNAVEGGVTHPTNHSELDLAQATTTKVDMTVLCSGNSTLEMTNEKADRSGIRYKAQNIFSSFSGSGRKS